jgi:hypothetical protein
MRAEYSTVRKPFDTRIRIETEGSTLLLVVPTLPLGEPLTRSVVRRSPRLARLPSMPSVVLEVLDGSLVLLGRGACRKGTEVAPMTSLRVLLA